MALKSCFEYWEPKVLNAEIGDEIEEGVILVGKYFDGTVDPDHFITLDVKGYGEVTYNEVTIGGSSNPYAISTPEEFVEMTGTTLGSTLFCHLVKDINFNDSEEYRFGWDGRSSGSVIFQAAFNGLNHKIKNLILTANQDAIWYRPEKVENLSFVNLIILCNGNSSVGLLQPSGKFQNVNFGIYLFGAKANYLFNRTNQYTSLIDCTFNIKGTYTSTLLIGSYGNGFPTFTRCHFNFDLINLDSTGGNLMYEGIFNDCYFTGKIVSKAYGNGMISSHRVGGCHFNNSYIAINFESKTPNDQFTFGSSDVFEVALGWSFIVKLGGIANSTPDFGSANIELVTESEAKNPQFLLSKGFPVGEIESSDS